MIDTAVIPDVPTPAPTRVILSAQPDAHDNGFSKILTDVSSVLTKATDAENSFANGSGDLQSAIYERARADVVLAVATAAAQRTTAALQSIFSMQV